MQSFTLLGDGKYWLVTIFTFYRENLQQREDF